MKNSLFSITLGIVVIIISVISTTLIQGKSLYTLKENIFGSAGETTPAAGGITSLGGLTGATQTFTNDTNVTISSAGTAHTLGWSGTLALSRGGTAASLSGANRIIHLNSGNTALTNTAGFVFDGTSFGIATATPGTLLSVSGAGSFYGTTTANSFVATSSLFVGTNTTRRFVVLENGNIGIGATSSPDTLLSVVGASNFTGTSTIESLSVTSTLLVGSSTNSSLRVLTSGNVGVGATTTESLFSIRDSANFYANSTSTIYTGLSTPLLRVTSGTASSTLEGGVVIRGGVRLAAYNCSGLTSNGSLTTDANGYLYCDPDDGGGGAVTVNSGTALRPAYYSGATTIDAATNILLTNAPPALAISTSSSRFALTIATSSTRDSAFGYSEEYDKGTATASPINVDWRASNQQRVTLGLTAVTVEFDNIPAGGSGVLVVCQDASGGRDIAVWPVEVLWSGGASTTQSSSPNACDLFGFRATRATSTPTSVRRVIYRGEASISE